MFKKPSKKQLLIRRVIFSVIATFAVLIIVTAAVLSLLGFRLDSQNGRLEQGALLQFDSAPSGATVSINGVSTGSRTASKKTVIAGEHTISMTREGYEDWNRTLTLEPGTLTWLNYIRLVPKDRTPRTVASFNELSQLEFSDDRRFALAHEKADLPVFTRIDLRSETIKKAEIRLPEDLYTDATTPDVTHSFKIVRWNEEGRYVLLTHTYNDKTEWLVADTDNTDQSVNISRALSLNLKDVKFAGTNGKHLYALLDDNTIRKLDLSAGTITRALVTHVQNFSVYDATIINYIGVDPLDQARKVAGVYRDGDEIPHVLRTVDSLETPLFIAASKYFGNDYVSIAQDTTVTILKGSFPGASSRDTTSLRPFATFNAPETITGLSVSRANDIVLARTATSFASYEIEHMRSAQGAVTAGDKTTPLRWLDSAYLWNITDGKLMMRDFDNANAYTIASAESAYGASLSTNGRFIYMVGASEKGPQLQRVRMILN